MFELLRAGLKVLDVPLELASPPLELVALLAGAPSTCFCPLLVGGYRWQELLALVGQGRSLVEQRWALGLELRSRCWWRLGENGGPTLGCQRGK